MATPSHWRYSWPKQISIAATWEILGETGYSVESGVGKMELGVTVNGGSGED